MNNIVLAVLQGVVVMAVAPFFSGLGRVIRAKMHNRRGPSIMQDYRDLAKLFARPESQSEDASFALRIMPPLFFAVAFMLAMGLPLFTAQSPIPVFGDAITIMYSLALARFFFALCGVDSSNAYAGIGGVRELLMSVLIEPSMLLALFAAALVCGSTDIATMGQHVMTGAIDAPVAVILAGIAFAIACYMELGKLPFDQAEAEQELQEGPLAELSGPSLAMAKLAMSMKQVLVVAWFCAIFVPWGEPAAVGIAAVLGAVIFLVKCLIDFVVCGVIENSCSRSRFKVLGNQTWAVVGIAVLAFVFGSSACRRREKQCHLQSVCPFSAWSLSRPRWWPRCSSPCSPVRTPSGSAFWVPPSRRSAPSPSPRISPALACPTRRSP